MPVKKSRVNILPSGGMDPRTPEGVRWVRNMRRWSSTSPLEIRPGFGQRAQLDSTTAMSNDNSSDASGGYTEHLGTALFRTPFGRDQLVSVFQVVASYSGANSFDMLATSGGTEYDWFFTVHGYSKAIVVSIFDLTTCQSWEEFLPFKTSEFCEAENINKQHAHFETWEQEDYKAFKYAEGASFVSFLQMSNSLYFSSEEIGIWVYHGIEVPTKPTIQRIDGANPNPYKFAGDPFSSNNNHNGYAEGSVALSVSPTRGINGRDVVYLTKGEVPRSIGMASIGGRVAYTSKNIVWFSDAGQPGAIMADNFATFQSTQEATAIASFQGRLFVFSSTEMHSFTLRPEGVAGAPIPGVIDIVRVETTHEAGCVSARSHTRTPHGICFVSEWGVHIAKTSTEITTISDPILDHWGPGLKDPISNYNVDAGMSGQAGKRQTPMLYTQSGTPSVSYDPVYDFLYICYEDHVLVFEFDGQSWHIWPLGIRNNNIADAGSYSPSFIGKSIVSGATGTFLVSGLYDLDNSTSTNPYSESESYAISELGFGGSPDRTIENEDTRSFGGGRFKLLEPQEAFGGGAVPALPMNTSPQGEGGWLLFITPVDDWVDGTLGSRRWRVRSYDIDFWATQNVIEVWPASKLKFELEVDPTWFFNGTTRMGVHPESGTRSAFTITNPALTTLKVETFDFTSDNRYSCRIPLMRFEVRGEITAVNDPQFTLVSCEATVPIPGTTTGVRACVWFQSERFRHTNQNWVSTLVANYQKDPTYAFDNAAIHERPIEWGVVTGDLGIEDGFMHRIRDIRAALETTGPDVVGAADYYGLYNVGVSSDRKKMSGQKQDFTDPFLANHQALQKGTIRDRLLLGKRIYGSVAKWSDGLGAGVEDYLVDNVELNEIDVSTYAKGGSISAAVHGRVSADSSTVKLHKLSALLQSYPSNRRKGR